MSNDLVFTYGSLQKEGRLHHLLQRSEFLGPAQTAPSFNLYDCGSWPAMTPRGSTAVHGEVYRVTQATLEDLDQVEGSPHLFSRSVIRVTQGEAWAYFYRASTQGLPIIETGRWAADRRPTSEDARLRKKREVEAALDRFQEDRKAIDTMNQQTKERVYYDRLGMFNRKGRLLPQEELGFSCCALMILMHV